MKVASFGEAAPAADLINSQLSTNPIQDMIINTHLIRSMLVGGHRLHDVSMVNKIAVSPQTVFVSVPVSEGRFEKLLFKISE